MALLFSGLLSAALFGAPAAVAATFTVTSNADTGAGTLRDAIDSSNADAGVVDTIEFDLPFSHSVISPATDLPAITDPVVIDGSLAGALNGPQNVRIDGAADGPAGVGLAFASGSGTASVVRGLTITGFEQAGLELGTDHVTVAGNFIGTDSAGASGLGNAIGVVSGGASTIGGETPGDRNVISGNTDGVYLNGSNTFVRGNYIGTDPTGTTAVANGTGVFVNSLSGSANEIGGQSNLGDANVISGNTTSGIRLDPGTSNTKVVGNLIGTQKDGSSPLGNGDDGVVINQENIENNTIGSTVVGEANTIAFNGNAGVFVQGSGRGDTIRANSIFSNGGLGIDLAPGGVTPNDPGDGDSGPNELQNFPDLATVTAHTDGTVEVTGTATGSLSNSFYGIDFYASPSCDPSGNGEGARYLGSISTLLGSFDTGNSLTRGAEPGEAITATATDAFGDTSEFSNCVAVPAVSGSLQGSLDASADPPATRNVDLTAAGPLDWAIWGYATGGTSTSLAPDVRKAGASAISSLTNVDPDPSVPLRAIGQFAEPFTFRWASGSGPLRAENASGGLQHDGQTQHLNTVGHGFAFDVPAGVRARTLEVYVITNRADGELTATLSDGSAQPYVATLPQALNTRSGVYTITYNAASPNQTLHVQWIETAGNCPLFFCDNAAIHAVALSGPTFTVNSNADTDGNCDAAECTLRQAINSANAAGGGTIDFAIPGGGPQQIAVTAPLPQISVPVSIDGTTEGAAPGTMGVVLNGDGAGDANGLVLAPGSGGSTIRGLAVRDFDRPGRAGILVESDDNQIVGNDVGTTADGTVAAANYDGVVVQGGNDNTIGGTTAAERNVISGNSDSGVIVDGTASGADGNAVTGNYIGVDSTGQNALANVGDPGVWAINATNTTIGGATAAAGNVIANNFNDVFLGDFDTKTAGNHNVVQNNLIGLSADGTVSFPNSGNGVEAMDVGNDTISGNTIASEYQGIDICGASNNSVGGNTIGTNASLGPDFGVGNQGISAFGGACLSGGGTNGPGFRNAISGNYVANSSLNGIAADSTQNIVGGNTVTNTQNDAAIETSSSGNTFNGNSVHGNAHDGIQISAGDANTITQNSIDGNGGKGISLLNGANDGQTSPVLTSAVAIAGGSVQVKGTLTSNPGRGYVIEYFASKVCDPSGSGEGATFLGSSSGTADAGGVLTIDTGSSLTVPIAAGEAVTATATDAFGGSTSEFSGCVTATDATQSSPFVVNANDDHDDGSCTFFDCTLREAINAANGAPGSQIDFSLPAGQTTITPASNLPLITAPTVIDATTQTGYSGTPLVTLDGSTASAANPTNANGFHITAGNSTVRGFAITNWDNNGVWIDAAGNNTIAGNDIGIGAAGFGAPNGDGILVYANSDNNTIGGTGPNDRNVISGNGRYGIEFRNVDNDTPDNNAIEGNYVGLKPDGTGVAGESGNALEGIIVDGTGNTVGGVTVAARNYVSGNIGSGIELFGAATVVKGNTIGLDVGGNPVANFGHGIDVEPDLSGQAPNVIGDSSGGGNVISGNSGDGIFLSQITADPGTVVEGNLIGTDPTGTAAIGNGNHGIETNDAAFSQIDDNTISGNLSNGVYSFGFDSHDNVFTSNQVGTNEAGTEALPNGADGIQFDESSGTVHDNVVSGNSLAGIEIDGPEPPGTFTTITGNDVGTNALGTQAIGNGQGIVDSGVLDVIGGTSPGDGNVISGNAAQGLQITGFAGSVTVEGNMIGVDAGGTSALPNATGVSVEQGSDTIFVGGSATGAGNVISGNTGDGVLVNGAGGDGGIDVRGNKIGTDVSGAEPIGNGVGVHSKDSLSVSIGGLGTGDGNTIASSAGDGVHVEGDGAGNFVAGNTIRSNSGDGVLVGPLIHGTVVQSNTIRQNTGAGVAVPEPSTATTISQNSIDLNGGLGIDLGPTGITPNDTPDADGFQNFPTITDVGTTTVDGTIQGTSGGETFHIDVFVSPACDGSGNGEGGQYLTTVDATTDPTNTANFTADVGALPAGEFLTMTATNENGDTSEFSQCFATAPPPIATNVSLTTASPDAPAGAAQVKLSNVPPSVFLQPQSTSQAAPVNETPVNETPVNELPVNELPVNEIPVNEIGFSTLASTVPALGDISLASIPLLRTGGWAQALSGTPLAGEPLQTVTLRDYYALPADVNPETRPVNPIAPITLADLDLTHSPLGSLPADAIVLANVQLSSMRSLDAWCRMFGPTYCPNGSLPADETVMAAALQGAPVNETPVNETPVNETPVNEIPVNEVPVNETPVNEVPVNELPVNETPVNELPVNETPVNETPVNELPVNETPVNELPVNEIMAANSSLATSPVNEIPVNELATPSAIVFCATTTPAPPNTVDCTTATLKDAYDANAIKPNVTLLDLRNAAGPSPNVFDGISIGDLNYWDGITIKDLVDSLPPNTMTLGDYFLLVLQSPTASQGLAWENLNLSSGLPQYSTNGSTMQYTAHFTVQANGGATGVPSPLTVNTTLGDGFLYVPGSSHLEQDPATCTSASPAAPDPDATTLPNGHLSLKWGLTTTVGDAYSLCFTARPGLELGPQASSIDATPGGGTTAGATGESLNVGDTLEPNNHADATAPELTNDSFYLSYLSSSSDVDYYRFKAPAAGTVVTFHLSHLPADYDLVVYGPQETPLRPSLAGGGVPLDEPPVTDSGAALSHQTDPIPSQTMDDLDIQPGLPLVGVSANRGTDPEDVVTLSPGTGYYTIQVTGYNGATSPDPYMLRVATSPPRRASDVPPRTITGTAGPALPAALPTGLNTVFVVNRRQLEGTYGSAGATNVMNALSADSARFTSLGFPNVTLSVDNATNDSSGAVAAAYSNWNANPGDPTAANAVVKAINDMVDTDIRSRPNGAGLRYIVLVGGDQIIPFARLDDFTVTAGNESSYADTFGTNTDLFSSLNLGQMLSDDPYATTSPVPYLTRQLYVPDLSVGRLVESPDDIVRTLNNFVSSGVSGQLDPTTSLTTGYDFLYDGASAVNRAFSGLGTGAQTLLDNPAVRGDSWTLTQLVAGFLPTTLAAPSITSLNAHASHYQFEPPANDVTGVREPLLTTGALSASTTSLANRLIFSMGCHAGLSVADSLVTEGGASTLDWAQAFAQKGAGGFLGNTGYGYGDTLVVAYSEELNRLFAQNIAAGSTVGDALSAAKQAYFGELGVFGVYDEKAMAEFTLYGLPMWRVTGTGTGAGAAPAAKSGLHAAAPSAPSGTNAPAPTTTAGPTVTDPATGLQADPFSLDPTNTENDVGPPANRKYWSGPNNGVQVTHLRPIQPKTVVGLSGTDAHGALITELSSSDTNCIRPVFDRPVMDSSANEPELTFGDISFPSKIQTVRTIDSAAGRSQQLVLVTGQFFSQPCTTDSSASVGVQRLFGHIAGHVFRSSSSDYIAPSFHLTQATTVGGNAAFAVDVDDATPGGGSSTVEQVLVALRSGTDSTWTFVNLAHTPNSTRWTGGAPISGTNFEYFVQAVDAAGNVAVTTNKGFYFSGAPEPPPATGGIVANLSGPQHNDWYTGTTSLSVDVPPGVTFQVSVDGGAYGDAPSTITGDGLHTIDIRASNGGTAELFAPIDTTPPQPVVATPADGATFSLNSQVPAAYFCTDAGSGVVTACTGTVADGANIDTSTPGTHSFTIGSVTDAAGNTSAPLTVHYLVTTSTTTTLASSRNPSLTTDSVTLTATVRPVPDGGTVAFKDGGNTISGCSAQPVNTTTGTATCTTTFSTPGTHGLTAVFATHGAYLTSTSGTLSQVVNAATSTALSSSKNPSLTTDSVTLTATVSPVPDGGTVAFTDGTATIAGCAAQTVSASTGKATCTTTFTAIGTHNLAAAYSGHGNFLRSAPGPLAQVVNAATTTTLAAAPPVWIFGQPVTFTATVSPVPNGGTVAFLDGTTALSGCAAVPVDTTTGKASCIATFSDTISHTITAVYSGHGNYLGSTSAPITQSTGLRKILFSSQRTGDGDIYSMNADGTGQTRLTTTAGLDEQPAWSPDGTKIAFASARNATKTNPLDIYVMDANGGNVKRLTTATGTDTAPSWSPDGTKIVFQSTRDGNPEIYSMNSDGSGQTRLTNDTHNDTEPAWSPDGKHIAFVSDRNIGLNIWTMNTNGTGLVQLTSMKQPEIDPAWSPDSSKIVFSSNRAGGSGYDLWTMNANGSNQVRITSAGGDDNDPVFSRDGSKLAFTSTRLSASNPDIFVARADGSGATQLTTTAGFDRQPDW